MALDLQTLDKKIDPFLRELGDRFFRNVSDAARDNIGIIPGDTQTETDLAVEAHIGAFLKSLADYPILGEESFKEKNDKNVFLNAKAYWICDPIDGTLYFQKLAYGEFGTLLALVVDGKITAGWAYFPFADKKDDIFVKSITPDEVMINDVTVSRTPQDKDPAEYKGRFGMWRSLKAELGDIRTLLETNAETHIKHSGHGHSHWRFASGTLDYWAYIGTHPWDFVVAAKIVTALGGHVYKFSETQNACAYEGAAILDSSMAVALTMPGVPYNTVIKPLFHDTPWEKNCAITPDM